MNRICLYKSYISNMYYTRCRHTKRKPPTNHTPPSPYAASMPRPRCSHAIPNHFAQSNRKHVAVTTFKKQLYGPKLFKDSGQRQGLQAGFPNTTPDVLAFFLRECSGAVADAAGGRVNQIHQCCSQCNPTTVCVASI